MEWALKNLELIFDLTITHLWVSLVPLVIGSVIAIFLARIVPKRFAGSVNGTLGALYAIPSLALFVALPALIGTNYVGPINVVIALSLYVVASMFFSARDAFSQVPAPAIFIARAQGMSPWQRIIHVELPLAIPGLIAGLRVAAASTVSMASIGAVVGVRNLGYLFLDGFQRKIADEIVTGLFAIFVIAIVLDAGLWFLSKVLTPWSKKSVQHA